jgi:hypothetical protein
MRKSWNNPASLETEKENGRCCGFCEQTDPWWIYVVDGLLAKIDLGTNLDVAMTLGLMQSAYKASPKVD